MSSNNISFENDLPKPYEKKKPKSKSPRRNYEEQNHIPMITIKKESDGVKYPVSLKSLSSNQNSDPMYKEIIQKNSENEMKLLSHNSSQNLSQRVNSLINEKKEKKNKPQTQKFVSKN